MSDMVVGGSAGDVVVFEGIVADGISSHKVRPLCS